MDSYERTYQTCLSILSGWTPRLTRKTTVLKVFQWTLWHSNPVLKVAGGDTATSIATGLKNALTKIPLCNQSLAVACCKKFRSYDTDVDIIGCHTCWQTALQVIHHHIGNTYLMSKCSPWFLWIYEVSGFSFPGKTNSLLPKPCSLKLVKTDFAEYTFHRLIEGHLRSTIFHDFSRYWPGMSVQVDIGPPHRQHVWLAYDKAIRCNLALTTTFGGMSHFCSVKLWGCFTRKVRSQSINNDEDILVGY